jgi:hyperosmotically inducible protein
MGGGAHHHPVNHWRFTMTIRTTLAIAVAAVTLLGAPGFAVAADKESVGAYVEDSAITTAVKARFVGNKEVDAANIKVETLKGTVMLSGFAKNAAEKSTAEAIAMKVSGVKSVKNEIAIRP